MQHFHNPQAHTQLEYTLRMSQILSLPKFYEAKHVISQWIDYQITPLYRLETLAEEFGISSLLYKDESSRFGLGSFKALGGAYAVYRMLCAEIEHQFGEKIQSLVELQQAKWQLFCGKLTVTTATDGNHGRSVAWGAQMFGVNCVIYIHRHVSQGRELAIRELGAEIVRVKGNYDDSVRQAMQDATNSNWSLISDTSFEGNTDIPCDVMQGYTIMVDEVLQQLSAEELPTHVFVQGGVGGLAAAVCAHLWLKLKSSRPRFIIVEPEKAACLYSSSKNQRLTTVTGDLDTLMVGLACGEVSTLAWEILETGCDDFITVSDDFVPVSMNRLATGNSQTGKIIAGESAVAGLCALFEMMNSDFRSALGLNLHSRVLLFGTEGATDKTIYRQLVDGVDIPGRANV